MSPQEQSLRWLAQQGYSAQVVEHHARHSVTTHDLFGCIDILALQGMQTLGVQVTDITHVAARAEKVKASLFYPLMLAAGWRVVVHGWRDEPAKRSGELLREVVVLEGRPVWEQLSLEGVR